MFQVMRLILVQDSKSWMPTSLFPKDSSIIATWKIWTYEYRSGYTNMWIKPETCRTNVVSRFLFIVFWSRSPRSPNQKCTIGTGNICICERPYQESHTLLYLIVLISSRDNSSKFTSLHSFRGARPMPCLETASRISTTAVNVSLEENWLNSTLTIFWYLTNNILTHSAETKYTRSHTAFRPLHFLILHHLSVKRSFAFANPYKNTTGLSGTAQFSHAKTRVILIRLIRSTQECCCHRYPSLIPFLVKDSLPAPEMQQKWTVYWMTFVCCAVWIASVQSWRPYTCS